MVSLRCKMKVEEELAKIGLHKVVVELGIITLEENIIPLDKIQLKNNLLAVGLELVEDKKEIIIEKIINVVNEMIRVSEEMPNINYSNFISTKLDCSYTALARSFSEVKGITLQHFIIHQKIERVKELLLENKINLTEISYKLNYSSVGHLCNQFKRVTGYSTTDFMICNKKNAN